MLEIFVAVGLTIMCIAGIFYLFRRQDMYIERIKRERGEGDDDDNGGIRH